MNNENDLRSRLVPAICTQCGGQVQVDPSQEAAVCQYCGTPFIVEKAIQNYSIQNAKIEHVDTVNINTKSTAESFFGFLGQQMSESREVRREERREQRAADRESQKMFFKIFGYMAIGMFVLGAIMFIVQTIRGDTGEDVPDTPETYVEETVEESPAPTGGISGSFEFSIGG